MRSDLRRLQQHLMYAERAMLAAWPHGRDYAHLIDDDGCYAFYDTMRWAVLRHRRELARVQRALRYVSRMRRVLERDDRTG